MWWLIGIGAGLLILGMAGLALWLAGPAMAQADIDDHSRRGQL